MGGTVGMALCSTVLLTTGSFGLLFAMTGALLLLTLIVAWYLVERPDHKDATLTTA
jgi:hypothetical protein